MVRGDSSVANEGGSNGNGSCGTIVMVELVMVVFRKVVVMVKIG